MKNVNSFFEEGELIGWFVVRDDAVKSTGKFYGKTA